MAVETDASKRRAYARLICRAGSREWAKRIGPLDQALRALVDISSDDFQVLRAVIDRARSLDWPTPSAQLTELSADLLAPDLPTFQVERVRSHLERLQGLGLIRREESRYLPGEDVRYVSTSLLRDLADLLDG